MKRTALFCLLLALLTGGIAAVCLYGQAEPESSAQPQRPDEMGRE